MGIVDKIRDTAEEFKDKAESVLARDKGDDAAPAETDAVDAPDLGHAAVEEPAAAPAPPESLAPVITDQGPVWPKLAIRSEGSVRLPGLAFDVPEGTKLPGVPIGSQWPTNEKRPEQND